MSRISEELRCIQYEIERNVFSSIKKSSSLLSGGRVFKTEKKRFSLKTLTKEKKM